MIKRSSCLSVNAGGSVSEIEVVNSEKKVELKRLTTYCRLYTQSPKRRGMLCLGFMSYPPCPDLEICRQLHPMPEAPPETDVEDMEEDEG